MRVLAHRIVAFARRRWRALMHAALVLTAMLALSSGCAAPRPVTTSARTPARAVPAPRHVFLWQTASSTSTVYLLGSIHVARPDLYPLPRVIDDAFAASDTLVLETDLDAASLLGASLRIVRHALLPLGDSLPKHLSPATYDKLCAHLKAHDLPSDAFDRFEPWFAAMALPALDAQKQGYSSDDGIDVHFRDLAEDKKRILSLEPIDSQVQLLLSLGQGDQERLLLGALDTDEGVDDLDELFSLWKSGDAEAFAAFSMQDRTDPERSELYRRFLFTRNENMSKTIETYLTERGTFFVIVGAAHLVGDGSIVDLLRHRGHRVEQLTQR